MIVGPTANLWVELIDQIGGRHALCSFDGSSDAIQEGFNILLGRLDEQFPVRISAHVLSEEIKAVLHVRNDGLLRREFKTSFLQKMLDQGLDFSFQLFFRFAGDDEVIRVTDEIDTRLLTSKGLETFSCWVFFPQESFKAVQRAVSERGRDHSPYTKGNLGRLSGLAVKNRLAVDPGGLECYGEWLWCRLLSGRLSLRAVQCAGVP